MPENKINYQLELDKIIDGLSTTPQLLLHSCCAPCSSYVLEYLSKYFEITILYYNPNIQPESEYQKRLSEQTRLLSEMIFINPVTILESRYDPDSFTQLTKGLESEPEGGARCMRCYHQRLEETVKLAKTHGYDFFTTTLSISPHKNAQKLNKIGYALEAQYGIKYLCADFKKRGGYVRSIALSKEYSLYRQNYCGCIYSRTGTNMLGNTPFK